MDAANVLHVLNNVKTKQKYNEIFGNIRKY